MQAERPTEHLWEPWKILFSLVSSKSMYPKTKSQISSSRLQNYSTSWFHSLARSLMRKNNALFGNAWKSENWEWVHLTGFQRLWAPWTSKFYWASPICISSPSSALGRLTTFALDFTWGSYPIRWYLLFSRPTSTLLPLKASNLTTRTRSQHILKSGGWVQELIWEDCHIERMKILPN